MIREAVPADKPVLTAIQHASLASPWPALLERALSGRGAWCLVAVPTTTPVGYALCLSGEQCYLAELAVDPDHRREGHGSALLERVIERTDTDEVLLTARADDAVAKAFYETHGFQVVDRLPEYFGDGTDTRDGLLLSKSIGS